jgi:hypothetical protein
MFVVEKKRFPSDGDEKKGKIDIRITYQNP